MFVMEMKGFCCGISSSGSDNGAAVACCSTGFSLSFRHIVNDLIEKWVQSSVNGQTDGWMGQQKSEGDGQKMGLGMTLELSHQVFPIPT